MRWRWPRHFRAILPTPRRISAAPLNWNRATALSRARMRISLRWPTRPRSGPCSIRKRRRGKDVDSPAQAPRMEDHSPLRVVAIGGGTGLSSVLEGLKHYARPTGPATPAVDITAIVTVTDDGGSSGRLRREFDVLPPGDIRNCM